MSETYVPNGTVPAPTTGAGTRYTILSSTNTSPIQVTFADPTGINTLDTVEIEGHLVNTAANGLWQVTKLTSSVYSLIGSTGNGVGGETGYAIDYQVTPAVTIPDDGDLSTALSVNSAIEANANIAPWAYRLAGKYRLYNVYNKALGNAAGTVNTWSGTTTSSGSLVVATSASALFGFASGVDPAPPSIQAGDVFEIFLYLQTLVASGGAGAAVTLGLSLNGGSYTARFGAQTELFDGSQPVPISIAANNLSTGGLPAASVFDFAVMVASLIGGTNTTIDLYGSGHLLVHHYRPN